MVPFLQLKMLRHLKVDGMFRRVAIPEPRADRIELGVRPRVFGPLRDRLGFAHAVSSRLLREPIDFATFRSPSRSRILWYGWRAKACSTVIFRVTTRVARHCGPTGHRGSRAHSRSSFRSPNAS